MSDSLELIMSIIAFVAVLLTIYKIQQKNIKEQQKNIKEQQNIADKVMENEKEIQKSRQDFVKDISNLQNQFVKDILQIERNFDVRIENIINQRVETVNRINGDIIALRSLHDNDMTDVYSQFDKLTKKIDYNHHEVMKNIESLIVQVTTICATFNEFRNNK